MPNIGLLVNVQVTADGQTSIATGKTRWLCWWRANTNTNMRYKGCDDDKYDDGDVPDVARTDNVRKWAPGRLLFTNCGKCYLPSMRMTIMMITMVVVVVVDDFYLKAANTIFLSSITLYTSNIVQFDRILWPTRSCRSSTIFLLPRSTSSRKCFKHEWLKIRLLSRKILSL